MVGLLLITHNQIGAALLETASNMIGMCPLMMDVLAVPGDCDPDAMVRRGLKMVDRLDRGEGVLILTDIYGSTPSNIAARLADNRRVLAVSGVNLPMLVRVMNYPRLTVAELAAKAQSGGRDGIFLCVHESE